MTRAAMQQDWERLSADILARHPDVSPGRMMSHPALVHGGKVFAFLASNGSAGGLGLRLGRDIDPAALPADHGPLAPFKTKPPLRDWVVLGPSTTALWPELTETALRIARGR